MKRTEKLENVFIIYYIFFEIFRTTTILSEQPYMCSIAELKCFNPLYFVEICFFIFLFKFHFAKLQAHQPQVSH